MKQCFFFFSLDLGIVKHIESAATLRPGFEIELFQPSPLICELIDDSIELFTLLDRQKHILARLELLLKVQHELLCLSDFTFGILVLVLFVLECLVCIEQLTLELLAFI